MQTIKIASTFTADRITPAYVMLSSVKCNKQPDTEVDWLLFIEPTEQYDIGYCSDYVADLQSPDFRIHICDASIWYDGIKLPLPILYVRCLFPKILDGLDRVLYLDIDVINVRPGLEELWAMDFGGKDLIAAADIQVMLYKPCEADKHNTSNQEYFNGGVLLMNLDGMRADGTGDGLASWCKAWDHKILKCMWHDQTLMNYMFKDKVTIMPSMWNNQLFNATVKTEPVFQYYMEKAEGYPAALASLQHAKLIHFCGINKPWNPKAAKTGALAPVYMDHAVVIWNEAVLKYAKR